MPNLQEEVSFKDCGENSVSLIIGDKAFCSIPDYYEFQNVDSLENKIDIFLWYSENGLKDFDGSKTHYYFHLKTQYVLGEESSLSSIRFGHWPTNKESEVTDVGSILIESEDSNELTGSFTFEIDNPRNQDEILNIEGKINKLQDL